MRGFNKICFIYIYILQSEKDKRLYIGQTNNLEDRLKRHNTGQVKATRNRKPLKLIYHKKYKKRAEAMEMEKYLKRLKGGNEFKRLLHQWGVAKW
ncbi:GIY-YIG nuclease family protein [Patescibacteria group bacterium]|nr:GIY-YIG nuclease family protein [Patescibacteria group bacterium]